MAQSRQGARRHGKDPGTVHDHPVGDGDYTLHLEDDDGETLEFTAGYEQLDLIVEAIEEQLETGEDDVLGVDDDEDEAEIEE
ncbi:hypothetical protein PIB19_16290 [Sphingomonas sp. 7/4-4]|uniref:hypothetical protein n=1 Tax=Sphingomonas sp. 7/4-4 TaxID=3018446 RepID=UPI0022F3BB37|nr:hypothetical protein [Sphingomonas sp. 7/4-4]WBY07000.1 hypothetical protein PIB19_16290 [Sphingomonas sp. 7/4-4]